MRKRSDDKNFKFKAPSNTRKICRLLVAREKTRKPHKVVFNSKELRSLEDSSGKDKKKLVKEIKSRYGI